MEPKNEKIHLHWEKWYLYHWLTKNSEKVEEAYNFIKQVSEDGGRVLFVGTKKQAQESVKAEAERAGQFYVNQRWLGGILTNYKTISKRIKRISEIEKMEEDGLFDVLPKKEVVELKRIRPFNQILRRYSWYEIYASSIIRSWPS